MDENIGEIMKSLSLSLFYSLSLFSDYGRVLD